MCFSYDFCRMEKEIKMAFHIRSAFGIICYIHPETELQQNCNGDLTFRLKQEVVR